MTEAVDCDRCKTIYNYLARLPTRRHAAHNRQLELADLLGNRIFLKPDSINVINGHYSFYHTESGSLTRLDWRVGLLCQVLGYLG